MKAAVLTERKADLEFQEVPSPVAGSGSVVVKVLATRLVHYFEEIFTAVRPYPLQLPLIPGCGGIGVVEEVGPDCTNLKKGDFVYCDGIITARDDANSPEQILQGLHCPDGSGLSETYRQGTFAEKALFPQENLTVIPKSLGNDAAKLTCINLLLVPYGGLLSGNFQAGESILILGGTGYFGSCGILVALAMGASRIIVPTRSAEKAKKLKDNFGNRVVPVTISGKEGEDTAAFKAAAGDCPIDHVLDLLEPSASLSILKSALAALRANGTMILMSGSQGNIELPYYPIMKNNINIRGCFMYPRSAVKKLIGMLDAGLVDMDFIKVQETFTLDRVNDAVKHAKKNSGDFKTTVLTPSGNPTL
ncbi:alcohol dehydrogenase zinc-binding domain protein [Umbelopsis sp. PMI_123]|nr:alcohol dehydrogenase zinc-binding domain protein [Umbelopsis sp. PMI_123]